MYTEFLAATLEAHGHIEEERIADAFDRLDSDDSGYISKENLKEFLGDTATDKEIEEIIAEVDIDNDGQRKLLLSLVLLLLVECFLASLGQLPLSLALSHSPPFGCSYFSDTVSYKEFLGLFRKKHRNKLFQIAHLDSSVSEKEGDAQLVGLEAKIPGGKYDSTVDEKYKRAPPKL